MDEPQEVTARVIDAAQVNDSLLRELDRIQDILGENLRVEETEDGGRILYSLDPETQERMHTLFELLRTQKINVRAPDGT